MYVGRTQSNISSPASSASVVSLPRRPPTPPRSPPRPVEVGAWQQRGEAIPSSPLQNTPRTPAYGYPEYPQFPFLAPPPRSLLELAGEGDDTGLLQLLSSSGEDAVQSRDQLTERGDTALHVAASRGHIKAVIVLVGVIPVNATGYRLRTPLHLAASNGHEQVATRLMDCWAKINAKDADGLTPMALAAKHRRTILVHALLRRNAKIDEKAMAMAAESGCWDLVATFLHKTRGLADTCCDDGHPILVVAAKARRWNIVKLLLQKGATASKCKNSKECALVYATKYHQGEIVDLLMRKETKYNRPQLLHSLSIARRQAPAQRRNPS